MNKTAWPTGLKIDKHSVEGGSGQIIRIHIGEFFGVSDYQVQTTGKWKLILEHEQEPIDLLQGEKEDG